MCQIQSARRAHWDFFHNPRAPFFFRIFSDLRAPSPSTKTILESQCPGAFAIESHFHERNPPPLTRILKRQCLYIHSTDETEHMPNSEKLYIYIMS
jgi:hypothetical protein